MQALFGCCRGATEPTPRSTDRLDKMRRLAPNHLTLVGPDVSRLPEAEDLSGNPLYLISHNRSPTTARD